jgi:dTDP-4-dehydrorhamnose reductase
MSPIGSASRFDYVSAIVRLAGLANPVLPAQASHFNRAARVPDNEAALNRRADLLGWPAMPAWQDSLARYLQDELPHEYTWNTSTS